MIYLLRTLVDTGTLLKIGYTTDNESWKIRLETYKSHNPGIKVVHVISEGTRLHEMAIHDKFRNHLVAGKEWFDDIPDIEEYIKTVKLEDIDLEEYLGKCKRSNRSKTFTKAVRIAWEELERREEDSNKILTNYDSYGKLGQHVVERSNKFRDLQDLWNYMELSDTEIEHVLYLIKGDYSNQPEKICKLLTKFEGCKNFRDKLKLLCEDYHGQLCEEELDFVFKQIPKHFRGYYLILGPEKIKSTCYNVTLLNKHVYDILHPFKPEDLDAEIYSNFSEGQKLTLVDIKDTLKVIYQNNDIQKTANAADLGNYFEISKTRKTISLGDGTKKVKDGFKLVKKLR